MRIILVRHGETTWNIEGRYQGQEDTPLSERGLRQGHLLAEGLHHIPIDVCISSPLQRSYQTCKFCADLHKLPVATDERLLEINHGSWEGVLGTGKSPSNFRRSLPCGTPNRTWCRCLTAAKAWRMCASVRALPLTTMQKNMQAKQCWLLRMMQ